MATDRREKAKRLVEVALKRAPDERRAFLEGALQLDPSIRNEVESLVATHEEMDSFEEPPTQVRGTHENEGQVLRC